MYSEHNYIMLGILYCVYYDKCALVSGCSVLHANFVSHALLLTYYNIESAVSVVVEM